MPNANLHTAKTTKNDEFYTQFEDIEAEINAYYEYNRDVFRGKTILCPCDDPEWSNFTKYFVANFDRFGLKKLISTSYAKSFRNRQTSLFELNSPKYNKELHDTHGKIFILERGTNESRIDYNDIEFKYLKGDGDFRSEEVRHLRDESDIIITNPPFSLFREFLAWIMEAGKKCIIVGNKNAITYKEVFPLIKANKLWTGASSINGGRWMILPKDIQVTSTHVRRNADGDLILNVAGVCWFANIDHGRRHETMVLMTMADNLKYNKKLRKKCKKEGWVDEKGRPYYPKYDNYNAIEIPLTECIPNDYVPCWYDCEKADECPYAQAEGLNDAQALCEKPCNGAMGVPITYMDKHSPDEYDILGATESEGHGFSNGLFIPESGTKQPVIVCKKASVNAVAEGDALNRRTDKQRIRLYKRIFIRKKKV